MSGKYPIEEYVVLDASIEEQEFVKSYFPKSKWDLQIIQMFPNTSPFEQDEFTSIGIKIVERVYCEVEPFCDLSPFRLFWHLIGRTGRIARIEASKLKIKGKENLKVLPDYSRYGDGIHVRFADLNQKPTVEVLPYCPHDCSIGNGANQCAVFGSYCQIELRGWLPLWNDRCSRESALTCPLRRARVVENRMPQGKWKEMPNSFLTFYDFSEDPIIKEFKEWCKTRIGCKASLPNMHKKA